MGGARLAAWLFVAAGIIGLANDVPGSFGDGKPLAVALDSLNIAIGLAAWLAPWGRWRPTTVLVLPLLALAILSINVASGLVPDGTYGVWLVLIFVWIGQSQPPRASLAMGPVAAIAYALPYLSGTPASKGVVAAAAISIPVAALVGFTIARKEQATQKAEVGQRAALDILATANVTDDLTGVGNRRRANVMLDSLEPGDALAILDLDHFKRVNDVLGHQAGDFVLQDLGQYLRGAIRGADSVARFGGEEFLIVLKGPNEAAAVTIHRLLTGWRSQLPKTTLSAGLAVHQQGQSSDVTFANADAALYGAKNSAVTASSYTMENGHQSKPRSVASGYRMIGRSRIQPVERVMRTRRQTLGSGRCK